MSFTSSQIVHTFRNADGTPASGAIQFTLTKRMSNGGITIVPSAITANLDNQGRLSQVLTSNLDTGTTPTDARWSVAFRILGDQEQTFWIVVPSSPTTTPLVVDLGTLLPQQPEGG